MTAGLFELGLCVLVIVLVVTLLFAERAEARRRTALAETPASPQSDTPGPRQAA